ncbi:hypothetical protein [Dysgonomonas sp. 25]|uniref:hypothetical protein n=1 Tax=Dysgonomonas sp. 25 TaxID=2302933 RepID=UPI0013D1B2C2|nr:hypothetical protein [Dysgonomonas sp. 25]NDV69911.1 hypothetical protein [Dysgonomonas sp. 25]
MKIKYALLSLLVMLSIGLVSCSSDDDNGPVSDPVIKLSSDTAMVIVDETMVLDIVSGNGGYTVFSTDETIATATIDGDRLTILSTGLGRTSVVIMDEKSEIKVLPVISYYDELLIVDGNRLDFGFFLGDRGVYTVDVLKGNPGYTVVSDNEAEIEVSTSGNKITVSLVDGLTAATANITVTDALGLTSTFAVSATGTTFPYNESEQEEIMAMNTSPYVVYKGSKVPYLNALENTPGVENLSGLNYYGVYYVRLYYPGDRSVGEYTGAQIAYYYYPTNSGGRLNLEHFKIIKNDGDKIWMIFSLYDENNQLQRGFFIHDL